MSKVNRDSDTGSAYGESQVTAVDVDSDVEVKNSPVAIKMESPSKSRLVQASGGTLNTDSIPLIIKKGSWSKNVMLCEVEDPELSLVGDSGAVGRMTVTEEEFGLDLKGRQYSGKIIPTHTVCLLNLAAPVGKSDSSYKTVARTDAITNEVCQLTFQKDILQGLMGEFTGGLTNFQDFAADSEAEEDNVNARGKGKKGDKDKDSVVISNVMNRKRKTGTKTKPRKKKK